MSVVFAVRGNSLNARYSTHGKIPGLWTTSGAVSKPAAIASADPNSIGGFNIDQKTTASTRGLIYPGFTNFSGNNNFSVLLRIRAGYTGNPPVGTHAIACGYGPTDTTGGRWQWVHDVAGKFGFQLTNEYNTTLINVLAGNAGDTAFSPVDGNYYDLLLTYDGSLTTNAAKIYNGTTLLGQFTASAAYATGAENRNNRLISGLGVGIADAAIRCDWELNEFVIFDTVIDPTSVQLVSGVGSLGTSRNSFVDVAAYDALDWTTLAADKIKLGETQTQNGSLVTGTYTATCDFPVEADVRLGTQYDNGALEGTLAVPSINDVKSGVVFDNGSVGTYEAAAAAVSTKAQDGEDLLDDLYSILSTNLNSQITAVEAAKTALGKAVDPVLAGIASDAWYRQTWNDGILNKKPAIFYGIEDTVSVDGGGATGITYKIFVDVVYADNGMNADADRRISRYARAIKEVLEKNIPTLNYCSRLKIEVVRPQSWKLELDSSEEIKVGGIAMTVTIY
jgi:hypothetical protein